MVDSRLHALPGATFWWTRPDTVSGPTGTATWRTPFKHNVVLDRGPLAPWYETRRHPQSRKYITYRNAARGGPSRGHCRQQAQRLKFDRVVFELCERTDRQTDRQTDTSQYLADRPMEHFVVVVFHEIWTISVTERSKLLMLPRRISQPVDANSLLSCWTIFIQGLEFWIVRNELGSQQRARPRAGWGSLGGGTSLPPTS